MEFSITALTESEWCDEESIPSLVEREWSDEESFPSLKTNDSNPESLPPLELLILKQNFHFNKLMLLNNIDSKETQIVVCDNN